jgi:hypothetical protein
MEKFKWIEVLRPRKLNIEVRKFKDLIREITFLIRALFFLVFGYVLRKDEILNPQTILVAIGIVIAIFLFRLILIRLLKLPFTPLFYCTQGLNYYSALSGHCTRKSSALCKQVSGYTGYCTYGTHHDGRFYVEEKRSNSN